YYLRKQSLEQIVLSVDQGSVLGPSAAAVPKYARRGSVVLRDRCEITINQRMNDPLALLPILLSALLILSELRKSQQSASNESRSRRITIAVEHAFVSKVVPGHPIFGKLRNHKIRDLLCCCKQAGILCVGVGSSKSVERPCSAAR